MVAPRLIDLSPAKLDTGSGEKIENVRRLYGWHFRDSLGAHSRITDATTRTCAACAVGGDVRLVEQHILAPRRTEAEGIRELASLLSSSRLPNSGGTVADRFGVLIDSSFGPNIAPRVKFRAKLALQNMANSATPPADDEARWSGRSYWRD
jgi:hypothetical protein